VLALSFVLAACAGAAPSPTPVTSVAVAPPSLASAAPSASAGPSPVAYPLTITDDEGTSVTIPSAPTKIVSLTPATTEILFALGLGPKLVGRTDSDDYPPEAKSVPTVATFSGVDVEKIVGAGADLVIAGGNGFNPPDAIAKLRSLHVPVVVVYAKDVQGVFDDIRLVGEVTGAVGPAERLASSMAQQFDAIKTATAAVAHPSVFYEIDATSTIYTAADQSFLAEMISDAGGTPVTTGSTSDFSIPLEKLVAANPQIILLGDAAYGTTPDQVKARAGWKTITAVQSGSIFPVDDVVITRPGPRLVQGLIDLVNVIHPELGIAPVDSNEPPGPSVLPTLAPAAS
jgi:iron complex transport system substrate-binding protein